MKGDEVLVLLPGGKWPHGNFFEVLVESVRENGAVICGKGRKNCEIAPEDIRVIPHNDIAQVVVLAEHGIAKK